jgi:flagella basal body P-ring formation protein FlgA
MVILTILAWATQTLLSQLGYGQTTQPSGMIEIRCETTIDGGDVTLKDVCRWNDAAGVAAQQGLIIAKLSDVDPVRQIGMNEIKTALKDAGVNLSQVQFSGSASCAVRRSDVDDAAFAKLIAQHPLETEQFEPQNAVTPAVATTRPALRKQLVLTRPLSAGQKLIATDISTQVLIDKDDTAAADLDPNAVIDQLLVRDMKRGDVLTAKDVRPAPLVLKDQFITISIPSDAGAIETVARAMEDGILGQIIKAKNEATGEIYKVTVTAAAAGAIKGSGDIASTGDQVR